VKPAILCREDGYADWVNVLIHGLKTSLELPYRRLLDVLYDITWIARILGLEPIELPDFSTVCARTQTLKMPVWRAFLQPWAELHDTAESVRIK